MSNNGGDFYQKLEDTGFFTQVESLQSTLSTLSEDIAAIGDQTAQRSEEMESIAAHVMAIEAVLAVLLKSVPVDADAVKAYVRERTRDVSGHADGSPTVQAVAADILSSY